MTVVTQMSALKKVKQKKAEGESLEKDVSKDSVEETKPRLSKKDKTEKKLKKSKKIKSESESGSTEEVVKSSKVSSTTVSKEDAFAVVGYEIENLTEEQANKEAHTILQQNDFNEFKIGGIFAKIQDHKWFGEYENFRSYVEGEFPQIGYRKAAYLSNIYKSLLESEIPYSKVAHLGWTKLKDLAAVLTLDNVDRILEDIDGLTVNQVKAYVSSMNNEDDGDIDEKETVSNITTITFKLHDDQKENVRDAVAKVKGDHDMESDGAALEYLALQYLHGKSSGKGKSLQTLMQESGVIRTVEMITETFPDVEFEYTPINDLSEEVEFGTIPE